MFPLLHRSLAPFSPGIAAHIAATRCPCLPALPQGALCPFPVKVATSKLVAIPPLKLAGGDNLGPDHVEADHFLLLTYFSYFCIP